MIYVALSHIDDTSPDPEDTSGDTNAECGARIRVDVFGENAPTWTICAVPLGLRNCGARFCANGGS